MPFFLSPVPCPQSLAAVAISIMSVLSPPRGLGGKGRGDKTLPSLPPTPGGPVGVDVIDDGWMELGHDQACKYAMPPSRSSARQARSKVVDGLSSSLVSPVLQSLSLFSSAPRYHHGSPVQARKYARRVR